MKIKLIAACLTSASLIATQPAFAERSKSQQALLEGGTFTTLTIAGTIAGGPIGMIVGAIGGAYLANETRDANDAEIELSQQAKKQNQLEHSLMQNERHIASLQQELVQKLTFQVLFATGDDTLNELDVQRVEKLATYLINNPSLHITLDGHTDVTGTDEYNNVLSAERAKAVKTALITLGVNAERIEHKGLGASFAQAQKGDKEGYAKDRKVVIDIFDPATTEATVAQH